MKNLLAGMLVAAVLLPAAQVKQEEVTRGADELIKTAAESIANSAAANHGHTWLKMGKYSFTQQYALQRELQKKGYDIDIPMFGSTYIGW